MHRQRLDGAREDPKKLAPRPLVTARQVAIAVANGREADMARTPQFGRS
jgi:hypothetical protein